MLQINLPLSLVLLVSPSSYVANIEVFHIIPIPYEAALNNISQSSVLLGQDHNILRALLQEMVLGT
jgi:hypothetical protein